MKKYKKTIEIKYENIKKILEVPIVEGIHKECDEEYIEGYGKPYTTWSVALLDIAGFDLPFSIDVGGILALDVCDNWHAFTKKQWEKHKEDEI